MGNTMKDKLPVIFQMVLATAIITACFTYFFWISTSVKATNNQHIGEIKTAMIAFLGGIIGYYFGSSQGSQKNADVIRNLVNPTDGTTTVVTKSPTNPPADNPNNEPNPNKEPE